MDASKSKEIREFLIQKLVRTWMSKTSAKCPHGIVAPAKPFRSESEGMSVSEGRKARSQLICAYFSSFFS